MKKIILALLIVKISIGTATPEELVVSPADMKSSLYISMNEAKRTEFMNGFIAGTQTVLRYFGLEMYGRQGPILVRQIGLLVDQKIVGMPVAKELSISSVIMSVLDDTIAIKRVSTEQSRETELKILKERNLLK